jgi:hypothetical protein
VLCSQLFYHRPVRAWVRVGESQGMIYIPSLGSKPLEPESLREHGPLGDLLDMERSWDGAQQSVRKLVAGRISLAPGAQTTVWGF